MSKRGVGAIFCLIAAILYSVRFINAALYTPPNVGEWSPNKYALWVSYVGPPWFVIWLSLIVGIGYLVWAEIDQHRSH